MIALRRHAHAIHELEEPELQELGDLLHLLSRVLHDLLGCEKEYLVQFAEMPGFQHVHFHLVARAAKLPSAFKGAGIFGALGEGVEEPLSAEAIMLISSQLKSLVQRS